MKTRLIDLSELKKKPEEYQAEELLRQLTQNQAIEVTLTGHETSRKAARLFRRVAKGLGREVQVKTLEKGQRLAIMYKRDNHASPAQS